VATVLEFRILGPLEVRSGGKPIPISAPRQRALLALLLLRANETVSLEELVDELWNGRPPRAAKASVHNQVAALRKLLGRDVIETHPSGYRLTVASRQLDLARFEALVAAARSAEPDVRATKLREALAEWRGLPLADALSDGSVQSEIVRLEELRLLALEDRIESDLALGRHAELVPELESLVERHPLRERLWGQLMLALYRAGRQAEALATYRRAHGVLIAELAIEPGPDLKELQRAILVQDPRLVEPAGGARDELIERIAPLLPTDERGRGRALFQYGLALWALGERERAETALDQAARVAAAADDRGLEELAGLHLSWQAMFTRRASPAAHLSRARRARRQFEAEGDRSNLAHALQHEGFMLRDLGRTAHAVTAFARAAELAHDVGDVAHESSCREALCGAMAIGPMAVEQAIRRCDAQVAIVKRCGTVPVWGWWSLGMLFAQRGEATRGLALFESAEAASRDAELWDKLALTSYFRSSVYELVGDWAGAERELRSAFEQFDAVADRGMLQLVAGRLARALVKTGNPGEAEELARWASQAGHADDLLEQMAWRQGLALVDASLARHASARRFAGEAVDLAEGSDWLNFRGETLEDLAAVEAAADRTQEACSALDGAVRLYERKGNRVARERAFRTLGRLRN
jgi:DNA-binding SARP family transcriptional activator